MNLMSKFCMIFNFIIKKYSHFKKSTFNFTAIAQPAIINYSFNQQRNLGTSDASRAHREKKLRIDIRLCTSVPYVSGECVQIEFTN